VKSLLVTLGVVIACAVIFGALYLANTTRNQVTIVRVFSEQAKAASRLQTEVHGKKRLSDL
jgi:hypothetical protein